MSYGLKVLLFMANGPNTWNIGVLLPVFGRSLYYLNRKLVNRLGTAWMIVAIGQALYCPNLLPLGRDVSESDYSHRTDSELMDKALFALRNRRFARIPYDLPDCDLTCCASIVLLYLSLSSMSIALHLPVRFGNMGGATRGGEGCLLSSVRRPALCREPLL